MTKLIKNGRKIEAAAKDFLIQEKKRPIEEDKQDIKACFNEQLLKYNFKQFNAFCFGRFNGSYINGITFDLL